MDTKLSLVKAGQLPESMRGLVTSILTTWTQLGSGREKCDFASSVLTALGAILSELPADESDAIIDGLRRVVKGNRTVRAALAAGDDPDDLIRDMGGIWREPS